MTVLVRCVHTISMAVVQTADTIQCLDRDHSDTADESASIDRIDCQIADAQPTHDRVDDYSEDTLYV